jgi:hypothetical protein
MKLSAIVGFLTLAVVIAGVVAALWQLDAGRKPQTGPAMERDLFGAPVPRSDAAQQSRTAELDQPPPSGDAIAPGAGPPAEERHQAAPPDAPPSAVPDPLAEPEPPAEPFEPPTITAYA